MQLVDFLAVRDWKQHFYAFYIAYCREGPKKKKKNGEVKLSFDPGGEYINVEIKYCLGIPKYITQLERQTASYDIYLKKYPCN